MVNIALVGSPNSGKSLLFNKLTGLSHKVANFPGATVSVESGRALLNSSLTITDYPGTYSLQAISGEEELAINTFFDALDEKKIDVVVCVLDVTRLDKSMALALQLLAVSQKSQIPIVFAANMADQLEKYNLHFDCEGLQSALAAPVTLISAKTGEGFKALIEQVDSSLQALQADNGINDQAKCVEKVAADVTSTNIATSRDQVNLRAKQLAAKYAPKGDLLIRTQTFLDRFFLSGFTGGIAFFVIMAFLFQSIFTWAAPLMDGVESLLVYLSNLITPYLPDGVFKDFIGDAVFGGFGAFLVFVPQIFVLTLIIGLLEDSGYLARAAVICHRPLKAFGLNGKSFVPMLSGVACAIPAIYAARTVESPLKRQLTYMAIPLMPCSARLPVYTLLIAAFIPAQSILGGVMGLQGMIMFLVYFFGVVIGLLVTAFVSRAKSYQQTDLPFVLEMPPYRVPGLLPLLRSAFNRSSQFLINAGPVIFWVTVVVWFLGYFPNDGEDISQSFLGGIGRFIDPIFAPLGLDWKYGIAILTSFLAREVFVGTLGTLLGIEAADENILSLAEKVQASGLPISSGIALLVFFSIALMCVSTLAVLRRETGSWKLPIQLFFVYGLLAYGLAIIAYFLTSWLL